jgi:predicted amidohydrolase YtcJ
LWAYPDGYIVDINTAQVGQARVNRMYPFASLKRAGARIVGGSDWDVSSMNPLDAIQVALTRSDPEHIRPGVLNSEERLDLDTMLSAYTINAAWLMHEEKSNGSIEVGKFADLAVLDKDLYRIVPNEISTAHVIATIFNGQVVYPNATAAH